MQKLTPEKYVMAFGKYKNMRAVDVADIYNVDKNGEDKPVGLLYLQWLVDQDWFKHKDIVNEIIKSAIECTSGDEKEPEPTPKEPKQKKEKKPKKEKSEKAAPQDKPETTVINFS